MSNAVYLIVAGVLLGPIEARPGIHDPSLTWTVEQCKSTVRMMEVVGGRTDVGDLYAQCEEKPSDVFGSTKYRRETTTETCERAMKEIGAFKRERDMTWTFMVPKGPAAFAMEPVFCIPAPSGLKR